MSVLVINSGSSSLKYQLVQIEPRRVLCGGLVERIGLPDAIFKYKADGQEPRKEIRTIPDHGTAIAMALAAMTDPAIGVIADLSGIHAVGHRIVHGGEKITRSEVLTPEVLRLIEEATKLAPLHNPANLTGWRAVHERLPDVPHVGVFDTSFHTTMPEASYIYPLSWECYEVHGIRRFGFHGTSHHYVARRTAELLGKPLDALNAIVCHLGNGSSLTAVKGGRSVDTTLGFGTMCGVPMGSRSGDFDPAIVLHLIDEVGLSTKQVHELIYKNAGLKGISGVSPDMRDVEQAAHDGNRRARIALEVLCQGIRKYIGALATHLDGRLDAIVFTAGIGENGWEARAAICQGLEILGAHLDPEKNRGLRGQEAVISSDASPVRIMVVPTDEEMMIALEADRLARAPR